MLNFFIFFQPCDFSHFQSNTYWETWLGNHSSDDSKLFESYCNGDNEVVYTWVRQRYRYEITFAIRPYIKDEDLIQDVMSNMMLELVRTDVNARKNKLKLFNGRMLTSLRVLAKSRAKDLFKKNKPLEALPEDELQRYIDNRMDGEFQRQFEMKELFELVANAMEERFGPESRRGFEMMLQYPKDLKAYAQAVGIDAESARVFKQTNQTAGETNKT